MNQIYLMINVSLLSHALSCLLSQFIESASWHLFSFIKIVKVNRMDSRKPLSNEAVNIITEPTGEDFHRWQMTAGWQLQYGEVRKKNHQHTACRKKNVTSSHWCTTAHNMVQHWNVEKQQWTNSLSNSYHKGVIQVE